MTSFLGVPIRVRDEVFGNLYLAESTRGRVHRRGRGAGQGPRRHRRRGHRQRPPLRGRPDPRASGCRPPPRSPAGCCRPTSTTDRLPAAHRRAQPGGRPRRPGHRRCSPTTPGADLRVEVAVGAAADASAGSRLPLRARCPDGCSRPATPLRMAHPDERPGLRAAVPDDARRRPGAGACRCVGSRPRPRRALRRPAARPVRVHRRGPGHGHRLRQPGRGRPRARPSPRRPAARRPARRARTHRRGPARPRHPTPVRQPACPCRRSPPRSARAAPPTASWPPSPTSTPPSARSAPAIFQLQQPPQAAARGLRARLLDVVAEVTPALGFDPAVRFSGLLDTLPDRARATTCSPSPRGADQHRPARPRHHRRRRPHRPRRPAHPRRPRRRHRYRRHHPPQRPGQHAPPRRTPRRRPHALATPAPTGTRLDLERPARLIGRPGRDLRPCSRDARRAPSDWAIGGTVAGTRVS